MSAASSGADISAILLAPVMLTILAASFIELSETQFIFFAIPAILLDFYLAARLSILFPLAALTAHMPRLNFWFFPKNMRGSHILILAFAPWPFHVALKLIEWAPSGPRRLCGFRSFSRRRSCLLQHCGPRDRPVAGVLSLPDGHEKTLEDLVKKEQNA